MFLNITSSTNFVLVIDLFEVDFVELVVLIKHLFYVRLSYLLQVNIEIFTIKVYDKLL